MAISRSEDIEVDGSGVFCCYFDSAAVGLVIAEIGTVAIVLYVLRHNRPWLLLLLRQQDERCLAAASPTACCIAAAYAVIFFFFIPTDPFRER